MIKNTISKFTIGLFLVLSLVLGVAALSLITIPAVQAQSVSVPSSVRLGAANQERDNNVTSSFTVQNNGNVSLQSVELTHNVAAANNFNLSENNTDFYQTINLGTIDVGQSKTVYMKGYVPADAEDGSIGTITLSSPSLASNQNIDVTLDVEKLLEIDDVDIEINGDSEGVDDGDEIEVEPGDEISLIITLENLYDEDDNVDFDVDVEVTVKDIDDGDDIEEKERGVNVDSGEEELVTISFTVPIDAEDDLYEVIIDVEGETDDNNNIKETLKFEFELDVVRDSRDVVIDDVELTIDELTCSRSTNLVVDIRNAGKRKEEDVRITVVNSELGIDLEETDIELTKEYSKSSSRYSKSFPITVPQSAAADDYTLRVTVYYSGDIPSDIKDVELTVNSCSIINDNQDSNDQNNDQGNDQDPQTDSQDTPPQQNNNDNVVTNDIVSGPLDSEDIHKTSFRESTGYLVLLTFLILVMAACIVVLGVMYIKR